ncbi:MAG TPA: ATP-binding protein, partial [Telluria sp.]|nr:ATP-binding protein [Telluria sp.]
LEGFVHALRAGSPQVVFEDLRRRAGGETYPAEMRWQLLSTNGRPVVVSLVQDITQRKQMERMKDEFVSVVNHELRTPLTSIHGAVKLLEQGAGGALPDKAARLVGLAAENTDRLRRIVDDILDLEQVASGRMQFRLELLDARAVLETLVRAYDTAARTAGIALVLEAPEGLQVRADAQRLHQVLANLASNAIKFAPRGSEVTLAAARDGDGGIRIAVTDRGPGIPEHFRGRIFQRFAQADMNTRRTKGGSGLGLSIAKQMTEHMGGVIGYESEPGLTVFHVTFPEVKA